MDLDQTRSANPTHIYKNAQGKETECIIPFSSDIKFNAFIRNMSSGTEGGAEGGLTIFLKGAPDRVTKRCTKILIGGEEVDFTEEHQAAVE